MVKVNYPKAIKVRNIKPQNRICCNCEREIRTRVSFYINSVAKGKYLCNSCEELFKDIKKTQNGMRED